MIMLTIIALAAIAYRVYTRQFSKLELALLIVFLGNVGFVALQCGVSFSHLPEKRYWIQSAVLLLGWAVWGIRQVAEFASARMKYAKHTMSAIVIVFALVALGMIFKSKVPGSRRYAYVKASDWAEQKIRADWKGPVRDCGDYTSPGEYHLPNRPIVQAHSNRLPYKLGGRDDSCSGWYEDDTPDYLFDEEKEIDLAAKNLYGAKYDLMDKLTIGKRTFALYRRKTEEAK